MDLPDVNTLVVAELHDLRSRMGSMMFFKNSQGQPFCFVTPPSKIAFDCKPKDWAGNGRYDCKLSLEIDDPVFRQWLVDVATRACELASAVYGPVECSLIKQHEVYPDQFRPDVPIDDTTIVLNVPGKLLKRGCTVSAKVSLRHIFIGKSGVRSIKCMVEAIE